MKFTLKYPEVVAQPPPGYNEPYQSQEQEVEPHLSFTGMYYQCFICGSITPFVIEEEGYLAHICSEECRTLFLFNTDELKREELCQSPIAQEEQSTGTSVDTSSSTAIK